MWDDWLAFQKQAKEEREQREREERERRAEYAKLALYVLYVYVDLQYFLPLLFIVLTILKP